MLTLLNFDKKILLMINRGMGDGLDPFMILVSERMLWVAVASALLAYWAYRKEWRTVAVVLVAVALVISLDSLLFHFAKPYFARLRPCRLWKDEVRIVAGCAGRLGFPSLHAANGMAAAMALLILLRNKRIGLTAIFLTLLIGFSRVYLGVHYPLDVLGGFVFGIAWGTLWALVLRRYVPFFVSEK